MTSYTIKRGICLPMQGEPRQEIVSKTVKHVAVVFDDFKYFKPDLHCSEGEKVLCGQYLATDRSNPKLRITAPGSGEITRIRRGERRALQSIEIALDPDASATPFSLWKGPDLSQYTQAQLIEFILESGLFTAFRERPFGAIPNPERAPKALFVTAIDTHPLAPDPQTVLAGQEEAFLLGLRVCLKLVDCPVFLCKAPQAKIPQIEDEHLQVVEFKGKHPAGLVGTHIHFLRPASLQNPIWHIGYQDIAALGKLFQTGQLHCDRVISLGGAGVLQPRLLRCPAGASINELLEGELADFQPESMRIIDGSVFYGRAIDQDAVPFLSRYSHQISVLEEDRERQLLGWIAPGSRIFSVIRAVTSRFLSPRRCRITSSSHGEKRPMVPIELYERVMPLRLEPTFLLRALLTEDLEQAIALGALELEEEDLSLCTFVSPEKEDFGPLLRRVLDQIWKENQ